MTLHDEQMIVQSAMNRSLSGLQEDTMLAHRILTSEEDRRPIKKGIILRPVPILFLLLMISTAFAAVWSPNLIQMLNLQGNPAVEKLVEPVTCSWETEYAAASVHEMLYDGHGVYVLMDVAPNTASCILLPSGASQSTLKSQASRLGFTDCEPNETVAGYASRKGLPVVFFRGSVENEERTFQAYAFPRDVICNEDGSWSQVLRFPIQPGSDVIRIRLLTCVYDDPEAQSLMHAGDPGLPMGEYHSITVPISAMTSVEAAAVDGNAVITESFLPDTVAIRQVNTCKTDVARYVEIVFDNLDNASYGTVTVNSEQINRTEAIRFLYQNDSKGYETGFRYVAVTAPEEDFPEEFDIIVTAERLDGSKCNLGTAHIVSGGVQ